MRDFINNAYDIFRLYSDQFYVDMTRNSELTFPLIIVIASIVIALIAAFFYYYIMNRPNWASKGVWAIHLLVASAIIGGVSYVIANNQIADYYFPENPPSQYGTDLIFLSLTSMFYGIIFFIILSFLIKKGSTNCSHIPFSTAKKK